LLPPSESETLVVLLAPKLLVLARAVVDGKLPSP
jgi:hypothetical protein